MRPVHEGAALNWFAGRRPAESSLVTGVTFSNTQHYALPTDETNDL